MKRLFVEVLAGDVVIGTANLVPADPSMGVAFAVFQPRSAYAVDRHASAFEQCERNESAERLRARTADGFQLDCAGIDLLDFAETLGSEGRELHVLGLERFQTFFD
ncbi:MAG: hypothetical protein Q7T61_02965 [Caulobacter sp.]|nr:hypothetical protein [Caulobacter sp.]